jgi:ribosome-binding ATPase YchF (GTP1/OBG family)
VIHVAGGVNPLHDIDIINTELLLADLDTVEKRNTKVEKRRAKRPTRRSSRAAALPKLSPRSSRQARPHRRPHRRRTPVARDLFLITAKPSSTSPTSTKPASGNETQMGRGRRATRPKKAAR